MNVLAKHIETLLLDQNCVIVPGLGGFVAGYVSARHIEGENLFLPPHRQVGFNPLLSLNDGLLVQSYMQAYDASFPEATAMIGEAVAQLKTTLQNHGEAEVGGIGKLIIAVDGRFDFIPNEAGLLSPELYALDAFECVPLLWKGEKDKDKQNQGKSGKSYTLHINKYVAHYAAAAIIGFLFYFLWATPIAVTDGTQMASMLPRVESVCPSTPVHTSSPTSAPDTQEATTAAQAEPDMLQEAEPIPTEQAEEETHNASQASQQQASSTTYVLVLVSQVPMKNATEYCEQLTEQGISGARVMQKGKMIRVVYGGYPDENTAYVQLNTLRKQHRYFSDAWVMKV